MGATTGIQWTDATWNPLRGCSRVSEGCRHCYAEVIAARFSGPGKPFHGFARRVGGEARWTGKVALIEKALDLPLRWKAPSRIFANSMSDLFHEAVPDADLDRIFAVMALADRHVFQVLTKRPERMQRYATFWNGAELPSGHRWPLPNVWLGVSAEDQATADDRIPWLLQTPAAVRFVSAEPLLGAIDLREALDRCSYYCDHDDGTAEYPANHRPERGIDWLIVGGESGPGARPCRVGWIRSIAQQCRAASVPCFVKQLGAHIIDRNDTFGGWEPDQWPEDLDYDRIEANIHGFREEYQGADVRVRLRDRKGGDITEFPEDLRVREFPR